MNNDNQMIPACDVQRAWCSAICLVPVEGGWSLVWNMVGRAFQPNLCSCNDIMAWFIRIIYIYTPIFYGGSPISCSHALYIFVHVPGFKLLLLGMVIQPLIVNPYNVYIYPYYCQLCWWPSSTEPMGFWTQHKVSRLQLLRQLLHIALVAGTPGGEWKKSHDFRQPIRTTCCFKVILVAGRLSKISRDI